MPTFRYTGTFLHALSAHTLPYYHSGGTFVDREIVRSRAQSFLDRLDADKQDEESESRESPAELHELHEEQLSWKTAILGVDVKVILTPPCIFCIDNH